MRAPIVILGGMGPQASVRFHQLLVEKSKKHHNGDNNAYPYIVHISVPVVDFLADESVQQDAAQQLHALAPIVSQLQPSTITLACNTAHLLTSKVTILQAPQFLSMLDSIAAQLKKDGICSVGLLASPTTLKTRLYESALPDHGIKVISPPQSDYAQLESTIRTVVASTSTVQHQASLLKLSESLVKRGADALVLGCTELPLIFPTANVKVPVYDCLDIYASAVIERYYLYNGE